MAKCENGFRSGLEQKNNVIAYQIATQKDSLSIDIQQKMAEGIGASYVNWVKKFNIKQMG